MVNSKLNRLQIESFSLQYLVYFIVSLDSQLLNRSKLLKQKKPPVGVGKAPPNNKPIAE